MLWGKCNLRNVEKLQEKSGQLSLRMNMIRVLSR